MVASGETVPHQGELRLPTLSNEGIWTEQCCEVAPITRPLMSIGEECDKNQIVVFGARGGVMVNLQTQAVRRFPRQPNGVYEIEMWIPPAAGQQQWGSPESTFGGHA